jgi:hypothetical protein
MTKVWGGRSRIETEIDNSPILIVARSSGGKWNGEHGERREKNS